MPLRIENSDEAIADARRRYETTGEAMASIATDLGFSARTLAKRATEWGWVPRGGPAHVYRMRARERAEQAARRAAAVASSLSAVARGGAATAPVDRAALTRHVRCEVERELAEAERALAQAAGGAALERAARALASLVKTLAELRRLEAASAAPEEDDGAFADLDSLRRELARRLAGLAGSGAE